MENLKHLESDPNFFLHLQTADYDFYCNTKESDENASVKMYDKEGKLLSDNYFASSELNDFLTDRREEILFSSKEMQYCMDQIESLNKD